MCEMLGEEPTEEDTPIEFSDLDAILQQSLDIYSSLRDEYDYFSGTYIGKNFSGSLELLSLMDIPKEDYKFYLDLIKVIDSIRKELYKPASTPKTPEKAPE